jgi:hypothetical protein
VSSESRFLFSVGNRSSFKGVNLSNIRVIFRSGVDGFIVKSNFVLHSSRFSFSSRSFRGLFGFFESHSSLSFTVTTFGIFFGFFEQHHSRERESIGITFTTFELRSTGRVFTNKFTFRFGTFGFVAFPVTSRFFTNGFTFGFGYLTVSNTMGRFTDGNTFRTIFHFTSFIGAHDLTVRSFTFNITNGVFGFLT